MAMLAPEQRLMMFADLQKQAESGAVDVEMLRQMQRDKLRKMSADQRQAYFADLTKRWNALPPAEQKSLKTAAEKWRAEHPRPDGMHGGRPGCPPPEGH